LPPVLFTGGTIRTLDPAAPTVGQLAVRGALIADRPDPEAEVVELDGRCVLPGFTDSHVHFPTWSLGLRQARLEGARSLDEALDRFPHLLWNLEIKAPAALEAVAAAVAARLATHRFLVTSFWHPLVERFAHLPEVECGLLVAGRPASFDAFAGLFPRDGRIRTAVWHYEALDPALLDQAAALGFRSFVYAMKTPEEHRRCAALGVTGVITDRVDFLR
jgi:glycerophosphoryl diester phosphodiesterase